MVAWMGAGAASRGIQGACERDQMQQVFSIDRRKWSYMGATNPWLLQPSMDCSQGGCRRRRWPCGMLKTGDQLGAVTAIENRRRQYGGDVPYPPYCRRGFSETVTVRPPAGPSFCAFRTVVGSLAGASWQHHGWPTKPCSSSFHVALFAKVLLDDLLLSVPCKRSFNAVRRRAGADQ